MQAFTQRTLTHAVLTGAFLAAAIVASAIAQASLRQAQADAQQLTTAEVSFVRLKSDLARWQKALASARSDMALRHEPLDLAVDLAPEQMYELPAILSKVFDTQGYFSLKQFRIDWQNTQTAATTGPGAATSTAPAATPMAATTFATAAEPMRVHITLKGDRTLILNTGKTTP
jgi:hypothetical protein